MFAFSRRSFIAWSVAALVVTGGGSEALAVPLLDADYLGFPVHANPRLLATADLTGDGVDDLVVADRDGLAILIAQGDGTFAPQQRIDGIQASAIAIAELTGDRVADIAVTRAEVAEITIYPGHGNGSFGSPLALPFALRGPGLVARDLDGDGAPDLAATDPELPQVWVWTGRRGGVFAAPEIYPASGTGTLFARDMTGDGRAELLVVHRGGTGFTRLLNDGHGGFGSSLYVPAANGIGAGTVGDFNGDGIADLAVPAWTYFSPAAAIDVWLGRVDGSFSSPAHVATGVRAEGLAAGDLDRDGREDLVAIAQRAFNIHLGTASGVGPASPVQFASQAGPPAVIGRYRVDGPASMAALEWSATGGIPECPLYHGSTVFTWQWQSAGGFESVSPLGLSAAANLLEASDFDGDGRKDVFVATTNQNALVSLHNHGDGRFDVAATLPVAAYVLDLRAVDVDGDGRSELVALLDPTSSPGMLAIYDVGFGGQLALRGTIEMPSAPFRFTAADFDGDGHLDFAVSLVQPGQVRLLLARPGDAWASSDVSTLGSRTVSIASGDVDHDGRPDLLVGTTDRFEFQSRLLVLRNLGAAMFDLRDSLATRLPTRVIGVTDLEADGDPEIVLGNAQSSCSDETAAAYLLRAINGALALHQGPLFMGGSISSIGVADVTGDGLPDLVTSANRGRVDVRAGLPGGLFDERREFGVNGGVRSLALLDVNDDGRLDVVVTSGNGIVVLPNVGGRRPDVSSLCSRLGDGGSDAILAWGSLKAVRLVVAGRPALLPYLIVPGSVRLAGAKPIPGRVHQRDTVSPLAWTDSCTSITDQPDGLGDLEVEFRADEVLDGWLRQHGELREEAAAYDTQLPFTATLIDGNRISGNVCALLVGRPRTSEGASDPSLRAFGISPTFESGVGVVLDLPSAAGRVDVAVYDIAGRRVALLYRGGLGIGVHRLTWSGVDASTGVSRPGAGIYFARAVVDGHALGARILVAR